MAQSITPARAENLQNNGLAITRRVRADVSPTKPLVVLCHGAMDRAASFARTMRRLPELEVIAYDRRGYGQSSKLGATESTIASNSTDLIEVCQYALACSPLKARSQRVVVVGHSLGGLIALRAALESTLIDSVGAYESPAPWLDNSFERVGNGALEIASAQGNDAAGEYFYRMMIGEETFARLRPGDLAARRSEGDALVGELRSLRDPDQAFDLGSVDAPVTVGAGSLSPESMKSNSNLLAGAVRDVESIMIQGAAHGAHLSRPDAYADFVRACVVRARVTGTRPS